jgi:hypothetical protein
MLSRIFDSFDTFLQQFPAPSIMKELAANEPDGDRRGESNKWFARQSGSGPT